MNDTPASSHDDGLEWLREVRRKILRDAGGDLKKLGERYRRIQAAQPEKIFDPRQTVADSVRAKSGT